MIYNRLSKKVDDSIVKSLEMEVIDAIGKFLLSKFNKNIKLV